MAPCVLTLAWNRNKGEMKITDSEVSSSTSPLTECKQHAARLGGRIEQQITQVPAETFLWGAFCSIGLSLTLRFFNQKHGALFVGQWAPTLLLLGVYSKLAQLHPEVPDKTDTELP
jgi:hypothetical protein